MHTTEVKQSYMESHFLKSACLISPEKNLFYVRSELE